MLKRLLCTIIVALFVLPLIGGQSTLSRDFFANSENGQPRVKIVYGQYAAEEDYENALEIAQYVANKMCVIISEKPQYFWPPRSQGTAPNMTEIVLTPREYQTLWYGGKPREIHTNEAYDETKPHGEIRFKVDLPNKKLLYLEYAVTNIEAGDTIQFLGKMYTIESIQEDKLVYENGQFVSSTETPFWYNTEWYLKVYPDEIKLYRKEKTLGSTNQLTTPIFDIGDGAYKWQLNLTTEWVDETELKYEVLCGLAYRLSQIEREKIPVGVDPYTMLVRDTELTREMKDNYNLILVGGPGMVLQSTGEKKVANNVTEEVVLKGDSQVNWFVTTGKYEYLENVFSEKDVVIVAGRDRETTGAATELFKEKIKELE